MVFITKVIEPIWLVSQNSKAQRITIWFFLSVVLVHLFFTYVIGISIGLINPFLLKICNIEYTNKKFNIKIRSLRLVFSMTNWSKVTLVLDGADVTLKPVPETTVVMQKPSHQKTVPKSKEELKEKLSSLQGENIASIFPNNHVARAIVKYYLLYFRFIGLKIFNFNVNWEGTGVDFNADTFNARISMHRHKDDNFGFKVSTRLFQQSIDTIEIIDTVSLDIRGEIDLTTGLVTKVKINFEIRDLSLPVMKLVATIGKLKAADYHVPSTPVDDYIVKDDAYYLTKVYNRLCVACVMVKFIEELNISLVGLSITEIPLANSSIVRCQQYKPLVLFDFKINSFVWNLQRMHFESPGYGLTFTYHDKPYHIICNFTGVSVKMHNTKHDTWKHVVSVPVLNATGSSNLAFQTIEAITNHEESSAKVILISHISEPVIDFSTEDLRTAMVSALEFREYLDKLKSFEDSFGKSDSTTKTKPQSRSEIWDIFKRNITFLPQLDIKLTVENPTIMIKSPFNKEFYRILVLKLSLLAIEMRCGKRATGDSSEYYTHEKLDLHNLRCQYRDNATFFESNILKVDDIALRHKFDIVPDPSVESTLDFYTSRIDLSEIKALHGLNHIFNEVDDKLRPLLKQYHNHVAGCEVTETALPQSLEDKAAQSSSNDDRSAIQIINDMLPPLLKSIKIGIHDSSILLGSRSLLISKELMKNIDPNTQNDLVNGQLRKIRFEFETLLLIYGSDAGTHDNDQSSSGSSLEDDDKGLGDSSSDTLTDYNKWRIKYRLEKFYGKIISEKSSDKETLKEKVFLKVPEYSATFTPCYAPSEKLMLDISISKVDMMYSVITHFIILSSFHVIRNTVFEFLLRSPPPEKHKAKIKKQKSISESFGSKLMNAIEINFDVDFVDLILVLPDKLKMRLELTKLTAMGVAQNPILVNSHYLLLCAESPTAPGYWSRLVSAVDGSTSVNIPSIINDDGNNWFNFSNECCHIMVPNQFVIYKIFENISITFKTGKQLHFSLKNNSNKMAIDPKVSAGHIIPNMNLKSNRLIFSMEDDPFEADLNMILQVGLMEQKMRVEKMSILEEKIAEELTQSRSKVEKASTFDKAPKEHPKKIGTFISATLKDKVPKPLRHSQSVMDFEARHEHKKSLEGKENFSHILDIKERAENRAYRLKRHFSTSWISRVKNFRKKQEKEFQSSFRYLWGTLDPSQLPEDFNRKVLEFTNHPSLFNLILEGVDFSVGQPRIGISRVPEFLHDVGKGIPLDTKYSTLIPLHVDLQLSELRCHLRDYPLPFIFMPPITRTQPSQLPGVRAYGDLVIAEQMIQSRDEVREVYVRLVPGCFEDDHDSCYSLEVPKTLTSIKFYTQLDWELNSEMSTKVTWGTSYQPCIQQIMLNLDNFTKPPVDISEKIGFWDKIRCLFHARMNFHWNYGGELHIQFKGSKNPYAIIGSNSGFLLGFKDENSLSVNSHDDPSEFLTAKSNQIKFSVPNLIAEPLLVWSRSSKDSVLLADPDTNFQASSFGYYLASQDSIDVKKADVLKDVFLEKSVITLSGGVQFNLALAFERKVNDVERSSDFSPHYDVVLRNPKYIEDKDNYDAYKGFRSEYIHLGFTLISTTTDAYNTVQLSPHAFTNFFGWWRMFSNTLPVRHGTLFGPEKSTKKFSRHLYTIKYQFILEPLFLSHIYHDSEAVTRNFETFECIGLKGRASKFTVDLHQRKEVMVDYNSKLGVTKRIMKMKFNVGKVDVENLDLRALKGDFELIQLDPNTFPLRDGDFGFETFDDDISWLDITDFAEISEPFLVNYRGSISASPLMFTPRFIYDKHNDNGDKYQVDFETNKKIRPFGKESFHDCTLGMSTEDTQVVSLTNRIKELESKLAENGAEITRLAAALKEDSRKHINQLKVDNEQLKHGINHLGELLESAKLDANVAISDGHVASVGPFCFLDENATDSSFMNRYTVHNMLLKWNDTTRNIVFKFIYLFEMNTSLRRFMNYKSLSQLDDVIAAQRRAILENEDLQPVSRATTFENGKHISDESEFVNIGGTRASERLKNFKQELREVAAKFFYRIHDDHLVRLIAPEIQLQSESDLTSCVLIVAPNIQMEVISFDANETDDAFNSNIFEQRFGVVLSDSSIFMFRDDELVGTGKQLFNSSSYGSKTSWPPWLGIELCYDGSLVSDHVLMNKTSFSVRLDRAFASSYLGEENDLNKASCDLSRAVFTCDAKQYYTLYNIIMKLLIYNEPRAIRFKERQSKMLLRLDLNDLSSIRLRIYQLQELLKSADAMLDNLATRRAILSEIEKDDIYVLENARFEASRELLTLMQVSLVGNKDNSAEQSIDYQEWAIRADDIKLHMLDEYRTSFLDVILENCFYKRVERTDRSDRNVISIENLEIINLDKESNFPVLFSGKKHLRKRKQKSHKEGDAPLIHLVWHMDHPVGGIRLMRKFDVELQAIQLSLEETTGQKIIEYAFPNEEESKNNPLGDDDDDDDRSFDSASGTRFSFTRQRNGTATSDHGSIGNISVTRRRNQLVVRNKGETSIDATLNSSIVNGAQDSNDEDDDGVDEMVRRASDFIRFISFNLRSSEICITFRGNGARRLINVSDFVLSLPTISLNNKTCTLLDLVMHLKKVIIKSLLSHTGSIIGNKISRHGSKQQRLLKQASSPIT